MGQARNWTDEEKLYLSDNWGSLSIPTLMKNLNRSRNAIYVMAYRLSLGPFLESGEYVTWNQFLYALGIQGGYKYKAISWIKNRGFPIHTKRVHKDSFKVVYIEEFWKWAVKNKDFLDFSKFEENALGKEPEWVKTKRKHDFIIRKNYKTTPWTKIEDLKLEKLLKDYKYTYLELSRILQRTTGAIQRRICELGLKERPIKADNHVKWTDEEFETLFQLIDDGFGYEYLQDVIGKSAKAIRGRVYCFYGTENLDKVRLIRNESEKIRA